MKNTKVLVISSNAFSKILNNGKTYESFFQDWPKKDIAQLFFCTNEYPDFSFCENYFKITELDVLKAILTFGLSKRGGIVNPSIINTDISEHNKKESFILRYIKRNAKNLASFRDFLWSSNLWKTQELKNWIISFNPDLVFYVSGDSGFTHKIIQWVHKDFKIPYVVYFTDDYVINQPGENLLQKIHQKSLYKKYNRTISNASKCYVIGQLMADDYSLIYKKEFKILVNSSEFDDDNEIAPINNNNTQLTFSYIGGLHLNRWKSLLQLGYLLKEIQNEITIKFIINIYSIQEPETHILKLLNTAPLKYKGPLDNNGVKEKMKKSDILIHVESFDKKYRQYTKYSISTKIPEYLSSKIAVLGYGPGEVASMKILSDNNIGVLITDLDSSDEKKEKLKRLITDQFYRNELSNSAFLYAKKHFNAKNMRNTLYNDIVNIIK